MIFTLVESSNLDGVAVCGSNLVIKFRNGSIYEYMNAVCEYNNLINSLSKGKYFHANIRNNYLYRRIV